MEGVPAEGQYEKLLLSPSVEPSEADPESAPLLSGDSSLLLESPNTEDTEGGTYFEMKVDRCSGLRTSTHGLKKKIHLDFSS